jgi:hypothetical protein
LKTSELEIKEMAGAITIKVRVQPRASRNMIAGIYADSLKVLLTSPPVDGEANQACIDFFAEFMEIPKKSVSILAGHKNRNKIVRIDGLNKSCLISRLEKLPD